MTAKTKKKQIICIFVAVIILLIIFVSFLNRTQYYNVCIYGEILACASDSFVVQVDFLQANNQSFYVFLVDNDTVIEDTAGNVIAANELKPKMKVRVLYTTSSRDLERRYDVNCSNIIIKSTV